MVIILGYTRLEYLSHLHYKSFYIVFSSPDLSEDIKTNWTVRRQNNYPFADVACDQTIEQTFNRSSKMKGGIVGFTRQPGSVLRWILAQPERALLTEASESFSGKNLHKRYTFCMIIFFVKILFETITHFNS